MPQRGQAQLRVPYPSLMPVSEAEKVAGGNTVVVRPVRIAIVKVPAVLIDPLDRDERRDILQDVGAGHPIELVEDGRERINLRLCGRPVAGGILSCSAKG